MRIPGWAWAAGAAGVAGVVGVVAATSSSAAATSPPAPTPLQPIKITQGHRYQVTLTLPANPQGYVYLLPDLPVGLQVSAPGEYFYVHGIAPNPTQVVYVVDAIGGQPGSSQLESPYTFYAGLNAVSVGGIAVTVLDLGPSPSASTSAGGVQAPAPGLPPVGAPAGGGVTVPAPTLPAVPGTPASSPGASPAAAALTPSTLVTAPALVRAAQTALTALSTASASFPAAPINGDPQDPGLLASIAAMQKAFPTAVQSGALDELTLAVIFTLVQGFVPTQAAAALPSSAVDAASVTLAQSGLARAVSLGTLPGIDYGARDVNGQVSDATFVAAIKAAGAYLQSQSFPLASAATGALDWATWSILVYFGYGKDPASIGGVAPVTPGAPVLDGNEVRLAQQMLTAMRAKNPTMPAVTVNGVASDAPTVAAVRWLQQTVTPLNHRTRPGVLDYATFAIAIAGGLQATYQPSNNPPTVAGPPVNSPGLVLGCQDALVVLVQPGGRAAGVATYAASAVDGKATNASFRAALMKFVAVYDQTLAQQGVQLTPDGSLDYYVFAMLFAGAYV